jgi:hypothetical protein
MSSNTKTDQDDAYEKKLTAVNEDMRCRLFLEQLTLIQLIKKSQTFAFYWSPRINTNTQKDLQTIS